VVLVIIYIYLFIFLFFTRGLVFEVEVDYFLVFFCHWRRMDRAYCVVMVFMFLKVFRMANIGSLNLSSSIFIDGVCVAALAPVDVSQVYIWYI
jgi:hypothetical protein